MEVHDVIIILQRDQNKRAPDLESYDLICRVCLDPCKLDEKKKCRNIHEEEAQLVIRSLIEVYTYVKIPEFPDNLPQNICHRCLDFLINVHTFRSRCRLNEDLLLKVRQRTLDKTSFEKGITTGSKDPEDSLFPDQTQKLINKINDERMNIFRCKDCHLMYDTKKDLNKHRSEVKHSRRPASQCPHCGKMFNTSALVHHLRVHTKEKPFCCETCHASFAIKANLRRHMKSHQNERAYTCEVCGKSFVRSESLTTHLKVHETKKEKDEANDNDSLTSKKQFSCTQCDKSYSTNEQLKIHKRYHLQTFLCPECGKVFSTKANLITHRRVHTGERPFVCTVCNKGFTQSSSLRTHQVIHSGSKDYQCKVCYRRFGVRGNLIAHERTHTGNTPHRCTICNKGFCTSSTLRKHMRKHENTNANESQEVEYEQDDAQENQNDEADYVHIKQDEQDEEIVFEEYEQDITGEYVDEIEVIYDGTEEIETQEVIYEDEYTDEQQNGGEDDMYITADDALIQ
ncbi:gastrula zinc finger protein XlCGF57.1-like [Atheta coriaria]|uniref:gastrula zinc finger protein XlCGF57.1-like n=1 Tax=Dalotia coriaria TaxID=877792 RepID=UPI0031F41F95